MVALPGLSSARPDARSLAIKAVAAKVEGCKKCVFFALPAEETSAGKNLIRKHQLFFVSTVDRIPPPYWWVAIATEGRTHVLDAKDPTPWNQMIEAEKLKLKTDGQWLDFVKTFIEFGVGRARYIDRLTPGEEKRLRKKLGKAPSSTLRIVRAKKRYRLQFYAKDVSGPLLWWDMIVESTGKILESNVREF